MSNETRIPGIIIRGLGAAKVTIPKQMEELKKYIPELENCYEHTINVVLPIALTINSWDVITQPIDWNKSGSPERFSFMQVKFTCDTKTVDAWIYHPHFSQNSFNPFIVEILAPQLPIMVGQSCEITLPRPHLVMGWIVV